MKVMFIKPALETDAIWDPIRTCAYSGMWYLASKLKEGGHEVRYLDEVVRDNGLDKRVLFERRLKGDTIIETPLNISYSDFQKTKMKEYGKLSASAFANNFSAFNNNEVRRTMVRTGNSEEETLSEVGKMNPDLVGIPLIASANYIPATNIARRIKNEFPRTKIIFGGQHVSANPFIFARENQYADYVVSGDAISAIEKIVQGDSRERIIHGGFEEMVNFPLLDPRLLDETRYPNVPNYTYPTGGRKYADFMFSKGCFRRCEFCVAGSQKGNYVTATELERIDKQLEIFREQGIQELVIQDDAFLWDKKHVKENLPARLQLMKKHGFYWQNNGGLEFEAIDDFVTEQFLQYNKSGEGRITSLYVPFNPRSWNKNTSASYSMCNRYHKNLDNLKRLREGGIYVFTSTIIGTPEQTKESFNEELQTDKQLIREGYIDSALPLSATMLPGTQWYNKNGHNIVNPKDYAGYSLFTTHHRTSHLTPLEIETGMIKWLKGLDDVQKSYSWQTAFPNAGGNT